MAKSTLRVYLRVIDLKITITINLDHPLYKIIIQSLKSREFSLAGVRYRGRVRQNRNSNRGSQRAQEWEGFYVGGNMHGLERWLGTKSGLFLTASKEMRIPGLQSQGTEFGQPHE